MHSLTKRLRNPSASMPSKLRLHSSFRECNFSFRDLTRKVVCAHLALPLVLGGLEKHAKKTCLAQHKNIVLDMATQEA